MDSGTGPGVYWPKDRRVRSEDGAEITYTFLGPDTGPVVALCSGFMCPDTWWHHLAPALVADGHRVLLFHHRGIASSKLPERVRAETFAVERLAQDLGDIVAAEAVGDLALVGHSMGVQVMLEAYRLLRRRVRCMAAVTGHFASPIRTLYDRREIAYLLYEPLRLALRMTVPPVRHALWHATCRLPLLRIGRTIRAFGPRTDPRIVESYLEHLASKDLTMVMRVAEGMHAHSAADLLPDVDVPTLVIIGDRDPFSPPSQGRLMAAAIPGAVARTVPLGTHGALLEYPEMINGWVLDFLAEHTRAPRPR